MFWTQFLGAFNDNFFKNALGILVVYSGVSAFGLSPEQFVPLSAGVFILPFFLFSATAGQIADKLEKSRLIRWIKLAEIGIMAGAVVGFLTGYTEMLLLVLFLMGTQSAIFGPLKYGILPQLLDDDDLVGGNALVELATYLAILGGTIVGGLLVTWRVEDQPVGVWLVCAGVMLLAVAGWKTARAIPECEPDAPDLVVQLDPVRPTLTILKITAERKAVFHSVLGITWFWSFGTAFLSLFPAYAKGILGGNESLATLFLAAFSIGIAAGSMLCERLSRHRLELGVVPIGAVGMSVFCTDLFLVGEPWVADPENLIGLGAFFSQPAGWRIFFDLLAISTAGGLFIVPLYTLIQQRSPDGAVSRVIAGNNIINALFMVLTSLALIYLQGQGWTSPQIFGLLGLTNALVAVVVFTKVPEFLIRFVVWMLSNVMYRVRVEGQEHLPKTGGCLLVANHVSFVDWFILGGAIKRPVHFVMDRSFASLPVMRWFVRAEMVIPIASPKRDEVAYEQAFVSIRRKLREGWVVGIFPEGRLSKDGELDDFRAGFLKILARDPVPVVPVALNGLWGSWFSNQDGPALKRAPRRFWSRVFVTVGEPVPPEEVTAEGMRDKVLELYDRRPNQP
jgi:1-acyl-sn-glycerol-3-phosphate acyltransferase